MLLEQLIEYFVQHGAIRLYVKRLAENDNSKNQIYLGSDFSAISLIPHGDITIPNISKNIFHAPLSLYWLRFDKGPSLAPHAKLILYPQYPEVRLSGFLLGSPDAPSALLSGRIPDRLLFLGITENNSILAYADTCHSPLGKAALQKLPVTPSRILDQFPLPSSSEISDRELLLQDLQRVASSNWIDSKRLTKEGHVTECKSSNCGGYTLEAELGIHPNSRSAPDLYGWEIKQYSVPSFETLLPATALTLMTPAPSTGFYADKGAQQFIRRFGYPDTSGKPDRLNFGGLYKFGQRHHRTKLTLGILGYDIARGRIEKTDGAIVLFTDALEVAAAWPFTKMLAHWGRKHAFAAYVPAMRRNIPRRQYMYAPTIFLASRPDPLLLLRSIVSGEVYYDPGLKLERASTSPLLKCRNQFRVHLNHLDRLYHSFEKIELL